MKKVTLMLVAICLVVNAAFAQKKGKADKKALKTELKAYSEANIRPVMQDAYNQLLAGLSADDKAFLNTARAEQQKTRAAFKAKKEANKKANKGLSIEDKAASRDALKKEAKENKKALTQKMTPFIERNQALLTQSLATINAKKSDWKAAKKEIRAKYMTEEKKDKKEGKKGKKRAEKGENQAAIRLLFWDAKNNTWGEEE